MKVLNKIMIICLCLILCLVDYRVVKAHRIIDSEHYEKVFLTNDNIDKTIANVDINKEINYQNNTIKWTLTYNKNHENYGGWVYLGLPTNRGIEGRINITRYQKGNNQPQHKFIMPDEIEHHFNVERYGSREYNNDYNLIKSYHSDGAHDTIRVMSDINWWGDTARIGSILVMTTGGEKPNRDNTHKNSDKVIFEFTTKHIENPSDFREGLDFLPAFIVVRERTRLAWDKPYPRAAVLGPFGTKGRHNLQMPDPIIVNDKNLISEDDKYQLKNDVINKTDNYYYEQKQHSRDFEKEYEELQWLKQNLNSNFKVENTGDIVVTWPDQTKSVRREVHKFILENQPPVINLAYGYNHANQTISYGNEITPVEIVASDRVEDGASEQDIRNNKGGLLKKANDQNFEIVCQENGHYSPCSLPSGLYLEENNSLGAGNRILKGRPSDLDFSQDTNPKTLTIYVRASDNMGKHTVKPITIKVNHNPNFKPFDAQPKQPLQVIEGQAIDTKAIETNDTGFRVNQSIQNGLTINDSGNLTGTPTGILWHSDTHEEEIITLEPTVISKFGQTKKLMVKITVLRDTDGDGNADKYDNDDDGDGISDDIDSNKKEFNELSVTPLNIRIPFNQVVNQKVVQSNKSNTTTYTSNTINGLSVDRNGNLVGTPIVNDWDDNSKEKQITLTVNATSIGTGRQGQNEKIEKNVTVTVTRKESDIYQPVGKSQTVDINARLEPRDFVESAPNTPSLPSDAQYQWVDGQGPNTNTVSPSRAYGIKIIYNDGSSENVNAHIEVVDNNFDVTSSNLRIVEGQLVKPNTKVIVVNQNGYRVTSTPNIQNGLSIDSDGNLTGTPTNMVWRDEDTHLEETINFEANVTSQNNAQKTASVSITILRDTDGDGEPDVTDNDDDNDGILDVNDPHKRTHDRLKVVGVDNLTVKQGVLIGNDTQAVTSNKPNTIFESLETHGIKVNNQGKLEGTANITDWSNFETERNIEIEVTATSKETHADNITNPSSPKKDETATTSITVKVTREEKDAFEPTSTKINKPLGEATTEDEIKKAIDVVNYPQDKKNLLKIIFKQPTSLPDGNTEGEHRVDVIVEYADGSRDEHTVLVGVTKTRSLEVANSNPIVNNQPIKPIMVTAEKLDSDQLTLKATLNNDDTKTIDGLTLENNQITGQVNITDWTDIEETRDIKLTVTLTPSLQSVAPITKEVVLTVQRDSDGDGDPDVTDNDDDNDGILDAKDDNKRSHDGLKVEGVEGLSVKHQALISDSKQAVTSNKPHTTTYSSNEISGLKVDENGYLVGTPNITDWAKNGEKEKEITLEVIATSKNTSKTKENETKTISLKIKVTRSEAESYEITSDKIQKQYGQATIRKDIENAITIKGLTDEDKTKIEYVIDHENNLPNGMQAGTYNVIVTIKYPDGTLSEPVNIVVEVATKIRSLTLNPETQTVIQRSIISPISITADKLESDIIDYEIKDSNNTDVNGLSINDQKTEISGTPQITDWSANEEQRNVTVSVKLKIVDKNSTSASNLIQPRMANNALSATTPKATDTNEIIKTATITVLRDTDHDGIADIDDSDDDNDGISDEVEIEKGSDPKDSNYLPADELVDIADTDITNNPQTVLDHNKIKDIEIKPKDNKANIELLENTIPSGLSYHKDTNILSGAINIIDWKETEEIRPVIIPIVVINSDGSKRKKNIALTIQRDTDKDGIADINDSDDDNDGISDLNDHNPKVFDTLKINTLPISIDHKTQTYHKALVSNKPNTTSYTSNTVNGLSINSNGYLIGLPTNLKWQENQKTQTISLSVQAISKQTGLNKTDEVINTTLLIIITRKERDIYTPIVNTINKCIDETLTKEEIINAVTSIPKGSKVKLFDPNQILPHSLGSHIVSVVLTYPDNSSIKLDVAINIHPIPELKQEPKTLLPNTGHLNNNFLLVSSLLTVIAYKLYKKED